MPALPLYDSATGACRECLDSVARDGNQFGGCAQKIY